MSWIGIYILSISIGICGVVWIKYLLDADGLLGFLPIWYDRVWDRFREQPEDPCEMPCMTTSQRIQYKIRFVLLECEKCFAGQLGFWTYVIMCLQYGGYSIANHLLITFLSIFFAGLVNALLRKLE